MPSRPANGLSLTEKVMAMVGSAILTKGSGSTVSGAQMVSPMMISAMPETATISPTLALSTGTRLRPVELDTALTLARSRGDLGSR